MKQTIIVTATMAAIGAVACARNASQSTEPTSTPAPPPTQDTTRARHELGKLLASIPLPVTDVNGLSGFGRSADGILWAVPERDRFLLQIEVTGTTAALRGEPIPMAGPETGIDTESLAILGPGRFVLGTESQEPDRAVDNLLVTEIRKGKLEIVEQIPLSYDELWGFNAAVNRGIEGLCRADNRIIVAIETVIEEGGKRYGPVASYEMTTKRWTPYRVELTSAKGKLSSLACAVWDDTIQVLAIERDYEVSHLISFALPRNGDRSVVTTELAIDLGAIVPGIPNMEGLAVLPDGNLLILIDNHSGRVTGPNRLLLIEPPKNGTPVSQPNLSP